MKTILVADDDGDQRELYVELFRESGFEVIEAVDGMDALEKTKTKSPDLIFTGIMMPRMTGFELIESVRSDPAGAYVPVIMFSHLGREEDRQKASKLVQTFFMVKGYNTPKEILAKVNELLDNKPHTAPIKPEEDDRQAAGMF